MRLGGDIWLDNVRCNGSESRLIDCPAHPIGQHDCDHAEDVGIQCDCTYVIIQNLKLCAVQ